MPDREGVIEEDVGSTRVITLSLGTHNGLVHSLAESLVAAVAEADATPAVRAIVITGAGNSFCVGADLSRGPSSLSYLLEVENAADPGWFEPAGRINRQLLLASVPVIAAINGDAIGGGATITLGADIRVVADSARFGFPFVRRGVTPEGASTLLLPAIVGRTRSAEWLLTGRLISAGEAESAGLSSRTVPKADVLDTAIALAADIAEFTSGGAVAETKRLANAAIVAQLDGVRRAESDALRAAIGHPDSEEGISSFLERRPARFLPRG
jgi:enoyl-CoA hydratase/carnithine racemase